MRRAVSVLMQRAARMHADGAIKRTAHRFDIVGDGAEAIIPLTNKRYVKYLPTQWKAYSTVNKRTAYPLAGSNLGAIIAASAPVVTISEREQIDDRLGR